VAGATRSRAHRHRADATSSIESPRSAGNASSTDAPEGREDGAGLRRSSANGADDASTEALHVLQRAVLAKPPDGEATALLLEEGVPGEETTRDPSAVAPGAPGGRARASVPVDDRGREGGRASADPARASPLDRAFPVGGGERRDIASTAGDACVFWPLRWDGGARRDFCSTSGNHGAIWHIGEGGRARREGAPASGRLDLSERARSRSRKAP
jgi:hypothetical protein